MTVARTDIEKYLTEVKDAVEKGQYIIPRNANRPDNIKLFMDYIIDESDAADILLSLDVENFSEIKQNEHPGMEHEKLYIFGKDVDLLERFGDRKKRVALYIKFNKLEDNYVIVISFHEQKRPLSYYFR